MTITKVSLSKIKAGGSTVTVVLECDNISISYSKEIQDGKVGSINETAVDKTEPLDASRARLTITISGVLGDGETDLFNGDDGDFNKLMGDDFGILRRKSGSSFPLLLNLDYGTSGSLFDQWHDSAQNPGTFTVVCQNANFKVLPLASTYHQIAFTIELIRNTKKI